MEQINKCPLIVARENIKKGGAAIDNNSTIIVGGEEYSANDKINWWIKSRQLDYANAKLYKTAIPFLYKKRPETTNELCEYMIENAKIKTLLQKQLEKMNESFKILEKQIMKTPPMISSIPANDIQLCANIICSPDKVCEFVSEMKEFIEKYMINTTKVKIDDEIPKPPKKYFESKQISKKSISELLDIEIEISNYISDIEQFYTNCIKFLQKIIDSTENLGKNI